MMNELPFGLPLAAVEKIRSVFASHPEVERSVLYGSRAKGNYKNGSDIDLTMYGDDINHTMLLKILDELDELLLPWMIDLSIFRQIDNESLREHIKRVGVVFYQRLESDSRGDAEGADGAEKTGGEGANDHEQN